MKLQSTQQQSKANEKLPGNSNGVSIYLTPATLNTFGALLQKMVPVILTK